MEHIPRIGSSDAELKVEEPGCKRTLVCLMIASRLVGIMPVTKGFNFSSRWLVYCWTLNLCFIAFTLFVRLSTVHMVKGIAAFILPFFIIIIVERSVVLAHLVFLNSRRGDLLQLLDSLRAFELNPERGLRQTISWAFLNFILALVFILTGLEMAPDPNMPYLTRLGRLIFGLESSTWPLLCVLYLFFALLDYLIGCLDMVTARIGSEGRDPVNDLEDSETIVHMLKLCNALFSVQLFLLTYRAFGAFVYASYWATQRAKMYIGGDASFLLPLINIASIAIKEYLTILSLSVVCDQASQAVNRFVQKFRDLMYSNEAYSKNVSKIMNEISSVKTLALYAAQPAKMVFTGGGFFEIGPKLAHSMLAGSCTYIIMLVQNSREVKPSEGFTLYFDNV